MYPFLKLNIFNFLAKWLHYKHRTWRPGSSNLMRESFNMEIHLYLTDVLTCLSCKFTRVNCVKHNYTVLLYLRTLSKTLWQNRFQRYLRARAYSGTCSFHCDNPTIVNLSRFRPKKCLLQRPRALYQPFFKHKELVYCVFVLIHEDLHNEVIVSFLNSFSEFTRPVVAVRGMLENLPSI